MTKHHTPLCLDRTNAAKVTRLVLLHNVNKNFIHILFTRSQLHFIFRHKNPKTGEFEEKHAKQTTSDLKGPYSDKSSHLYTLVVNPDNTFQMYIDQKEVNTGSLLKDMR